MKTTIEKKLTKARTALLMGAPFFGSLALKLEMVPDPDAETAWTDGRQLGFNADYIQSLPMDALKGLLAHEVMHLALCHHTRQESRDFRIWNRACDYAINQLLKDAGKPITQPASVSMKYQVRRNIPGSPLDRPLAWDSGKRIRLVRIASSLWIIHNDGNYNEGMNICQ